MSDHKLTKSVGEHFVCAVLAQQGWAASLTRDGLAHTDVLAVHTEDRRAMIEIQVKTSTTTARPSWLLGLVSPDVSGREWYVLVALGDSIRDRPRCFVVPRDHCAAGTWISHQDWLTSPDVPAGKRNTRIERARSGVDVWGGYEERWDLLAEPTGKSPVLLPARHRNLMKEPRVGLSPGHPWLTKAPPQAAWQFN